VFYAGRYVESPYHETFHRGPNDLKLRHCSLSNILKVLIHNLELNIDLIQQTPTPMFEYGLKRPNSDDLRINAGNA
jgi:hypothetical protein